MKLFCAILVVYLVALTLLGVEARRGSTKGLRETLATSVRLRPELGAEEARRHALKTEGGTLARNEEPTPPAHLRSRRGAAVMDHQLEMAGEEPAPPPQFRQRRQMPAPPEGMPAPPQGMPAPPEGMPAPPSY